MQPASPQRSAETTSVNVQASVSLRENGEVLAPHPGLALRETGEDLSTLVANGPRVSRLPAVPDGYQETAVAFHDAAVTLGRRVIWEHGTFSIQQGAFVALIGPNGSGKTTLLRAILGQIPLSAGQLEVLGAPPRRGNRAIGLVSQRHAVELDLAVRGRDLVMLGLSGHRWGIGRPSAAEHQLVADTLRAVGAEDYADEPVGVLSGGEQQRLMVAQAVLTEPRLLLLDEPLSSLDMSSQSEIVALVNSLCRARGITVLLISHDLNPLVGVLDQVVYILDGRPVAGTLDAVVRPELLSRLYHAPVRVVRSPEGLPLVTGA